MLGGQEMSPTSFRLQQSAHFVNSSSYIVYDHSTGALELEQLRYDEVAARSSSCSERDSAQSAASSFNPS